MAYSSQAVAEHGVAGSDQEQHANECEEDDVEHEKLLQHEVHLDRFPELLRAGRLTSTAPHLWSPVISRCHRKVSRSPEKSGNRPYVALPDKNSIREGAGKYKHFINDDRFLIVALNQGIVKKGRILAYALDYSCNPNAEPRRSLMRRPLPLVIRSIAYALRGGFLVRPLGIALLLGVAGAVLGRSRRLRMVHLGQLGVGANTFARGKTNCWQTGSKS